MHRNDRQGYLETLIRSGEFRFDKLAIRGIDNSRVIELFGPEMSAQETCLFYKSMTDGNGYVEMLHLRISNGMNSRIGTPVVRFADGEYAFYELSLKCNGLYRQAESVEAIRSALPAHVRDLKYVAEMGIHAPLVFPGNVYRVKRKFPFIRKPSGDDSAAKFLGFISRNGVELTGSNYVPFYAVYAYLTSKRFAAAVDGRNLCIINSDINGEACRRWFEDFSSRPRISEVRIPASYVATRWASMEGEVLARVPGDADLCLVGAGIGALPVCAAVSRRMSIPSLDAGHALNMMNDMEKKSAGPRLYTIHK